ncbi:multidrug efflux protein [Legionella quinlivanii]|uniref:Multidrug efflux protein n=1 Tax=Legionella quinlivanii TaxID=45073 RepID=A0A0W0XP51_9GAMM|nr:multidrug efflux protein [Legionella quinlivanii]SEG09703.1 Very-short-patch-repair endonuclease [Legionella quinlivanii DSM 21216]STY10233.1 putative restriction endonuclease-like [Legionella quinlivanii]
MDQSTLKQRARVLRKNSTDAERHLWYYLRANRLKFKFKRQAPIGAYIVDFLCFEKRLIVELGGQHMESQIYDIKRTDWLRGNGFRVFRFWNNEVFQQTQSVLEVITSALHTGMTDNPLQHLHRNHKKNNRPKYIENRR